MTVFLRKWMMLLGIGLIAGLAVGCGSAPDAGSDSSGPSVEQLDAEISGVIRPLKLVKEEYRDAVADGDVIDKGEYQEAMLFAESTVQKWESLEPALEEQFSADERAELGSDIQKLLAHVEAKRSVADAEALIGSIYGSLSALRVSDVAPELKEVVKSVKMADGQLGAEKTKNDQRIGVALTTPSTIHRGEAVVSDAAGNDYQLRVLLREQRTKRELPGARIRARFLDGGGELLKEVELLETWGSYLFYGENITIPPHAAELSVVVKPSLVGRHGEMKEISTERFATNFGLTTVDGNWRVEGPSPEPLPEDVSLGTDVQLALEEPLKFRETKQYKIGLIAEHAEPYWNPSEQDGAVEFELADLADNANRHMEISLLDQETNRIIPHAEITLDFEPIASGEALGAELPFLLAAFNHYGHSLYIPGGTYRVEATVERPRINHLDPKPFPDTVTVDYEWTNEVEAHT